MRDKPYLVFHAFPCDLAQVDTQASTPSFEEHENTLNNSTWPCPSKTSSDAACTPPRLPDIAKQPMMSFWPRCKGNQRVMQVKQETSMSQTPPPQTPSGLHTGNIRAGGKIQADNVVAGVQVQGGDAATARHASTRRKRCSRRVASKPCRTSSPQTS
jgi:hypothetical protein